MARTSSSSQKKRNIFLRIIGVVFQLLVMVLMPFVILMKGTTWLYEVHQWPWWLGLLAMTAVNALLLLIYVAMIWDALIGPGKMSRRSIKGKFTLVVLLLAGFLGMSLFNLSGQHAKGEEVKKEYTSLHPLLRLSVGTLVLFNQTLLITDMNRVPEDYRKMGLKNKKRSLHYPQSDGFVHAMDLRTNGHSELRNTLLKTYFQLMGFQTLRHTGTGDHLHVSLYSRDNPGAL